MTKIRCPNPKCNIFFELDEGQKKCRYCGAFLFGKNKGSLPKEKPIDIKEKLPFEVSGYNGSLLIEQRKVTIKRGLKGVFLGGMRLRGDKAIPIKSITAVQLKDPGLTAGYIQFSIMGGREAKQGLIQAGYDENTIMFWRHYEKFVEAKSIIEELIYGPENEVEQKSDLDKLEKLAELKDKGVITEEEFKKKKKQLLGI